MGSAPVGSVYVSLGALGLGRSIARDEWISSEFLLFEMEATSLLELPKRALKVPAAQGDPLRGCFSTCALSRFQVDTLQTPVQAKP